MLAAKIIAIKLIWIKMKQKTAEKLLKTVQNNYRDIASQFDVTRKKYVWPELENILDFLNEGSSVLDVGCGNGRLLDNLKNKKITYLGIDSSGELVACAKNNYPENDFVVGNILSLNEVVKQKFDLVISVAVLHHLPGRALRIAALNQLKSVCADSGKIIFSVWKIWPNKKYWKYLLKNIWDKIILRSDLDFGDLLFPWKDNQGQALSERYYHAFTKRSLKKLLKAAGFNKFTLTDSGSNYWVSLDTH